jgi:P4 family phage/plasmid primase-like protien
VDGGWKWREMSNEQLTAMLTPICEKWVSWAKTDYLPANIKRSTIDEVLAAAIGYVHATGTSMPMWLPPSFDAVGMPTWRPSISLDVEAVTDELLPKDVVTFPDGLFNAKAWCERRFEMLPLSPRWFSATTMGYKLPQELKLIDVGDDDAVAALAEKLAPTWHRVIREVFNDDPERISTIQEWFGYNCVPDNSYQKIMWLQGFPGTGKGTITHAFRLLLGEDAVAHSDMVALGERFTAAGFVGKYAVIVPEVHTDARTPIAAALNLVKSVSGDDPVSVRDLFMSAIMNVHLICRWFFTPNDAPNFRDPSNALERRLLVVPTGVPIAKPDPMLKEKLTAEGGAGIFLWAMLGLRRLRERGGFVSPAAGREMMEDIKRTSNPVLGYAEDRCIRGAGHSVHKSVLYADYLAWAQSQGMDRPLTSATFGKDLKSACIGVRSHAETTHRKRRWYYQGIRPLVDPYDAGDSEVLNMRLEPAGYGDSVYGGTTFSGVEVKVETATDQPVLAAAARDREELPF